MKFKCAKQCRGAAASAGFTLAEVLAALLFMAIVIPVAVEGLRIANLAGQVGVRKAQAARVGENLLNELLVTGQLENSAAGGTIREGEQVYRWTVQSQPWPQDDMRWVTIQIVFTVQGREFVVPLSTLIANASS